MKRITEMARKISHFSNSPCSQSNFNQIQIFLDIRGRIHSCYLFKYLENFGKGSPYYTRDDIYYDGIRGRGPVRVLTGLNLATHTRICGYP